MQGSDNAASPSSPSTIASPRTDTLAPRSVPQRPLSQSGYAAEPSSAVRPQPVPRANRLVTEPMVKDMPRTQTQQQPPPFQAQARASSATASRSAPSFSPASPASPTEAPRLISGTLLRGGRYRLQELQERQVWLAGAYEASWVAQDAHRAGQQVTITEVVLPESSPVVVQSTLRTATMALTAVGRHPHIPTLWDAFSDRGRHFFVFEPIDGESLLSRMRRTGRALPEQDAIECCLQMTEVLELLAQQSPPLLHGLIKPEHIIIRSGSQYVLTNFSIVLAGGATQFVSGIDRTLLSPYAAPEFARGVIDVRLDLYSLLATIYHAVTGSVPAGVSGSIPAAQRLNPNISAQFDAILAKGLRPIAGQRYQRPSELRQDLLAMRSVSGSLAPGTGQRQEQAATRVPDSIAQALQSLAPAGDFEERKSLLPRPEELPPLEEKNDWLHATLWLVLILAGLLLITILGRGFF